MCPAQVAQTFVELAFIARAEKFYTAHPSNFANAALAWANRTAVTVPTSESHKQWASQCVAPPRQRGTERSATASARPADQPARPTHHHHG